MAANRPGWHAHMTSFLKLIVQMFKAGGKFGHVQNVGSSLKYPICFDSKIVQLCSDHSRACLDATPHATGQLTRHFDIKHAATPINKLASLKTEDVKTDLDSAPEGAHSYSLPDEISLR